MNTMHLIGSEDVSRAGHNMQQAANTINGAASTIQAAAHSMAGQLETHGYQMEALATAMASAPTLRDYFIAHAPAEPQSWFRPVMSTECPPTVFMDEARKTTYANSIDAERECGDCFLNVNEKDQLTWKAERDKQRYVQWPAAWAGAMLKAREA